MTDNTLLTEHDVKIPCMLRRVYSVWYRHFAVYTKNIISNAFPPFVEPILFLAAFTVGFGVYFTKMGGMNYLTFIASGILLIPAMFSASFECTMGTYVRLEFDKIYDGMLSSSINVKDLVLGELLFVATKGFIFTLSFLIVTYVAGIITAPAAFLVVFAGFIAGALFGAIALLYTSFIANINYFNFYFSGFLTIMYLFSGVMFPVENIPQKLRWISEALPLTHCVRLARAFCNGTYNTNLFYGGVYIIVITTVATLFAIKRFQKRIIG
jgi:lipooligosaccharide transport system permease protein